MTYQEVTTDGEFNQVVEESNLWRDGLDVVVPYMNPTKHHNIAHISHKDLMANKKELRQQKANCTS